MKKKLIEIIDSISKKKITNIFLDLIDMDTVFLNYHRVLSDLEFQNTNRPNNDLVVSKKIFENQINYLKENFEVISINEIHQKKNKKRKVVITFDDGYFDNLKNALPILEKYSCPATIYIATSFLDNKVIPWWLLIWKIISSQKQLNFNNKIINITEKKHKKNFYEMLCRKLISLNKNQQDIIINDLFDAHISEEDNIKEFLSSEDLTNLGNNNLIEIGCHTHTHQNLKVLNKEEIHNEIINSKSILEKIVKKKINHLSIPYGSKNCFDEKIIEQLSGYDFKTIVTTEHDIFRKNKCNRIPRIGIGNQDINDRLHSKSIGIDSLLNKILRR